MKTCSKCKETKPFEAFSNHHASSDGKTSQCKDCFHAYYEARKDEYAKRRSRYYRENKERLDAYNKAYYAPVRKEYTKKFNDRRKERNLSAGKMPSREVLLLKLEQYGGRCWICGTEVKADAPRFQPDGLTWDHVKPLCKGGTNALINLRPTCYACNSAKGSKWFGVANINKLVALVKENRAG